MLMDSFWLKADMLYEGPSPVGDVFPNKVKAPAIIIAKTITTMSIYAYFSYFHRFVIIVNLFHVIKFLVKLHILYNYIYVIQVNLSGFDCNFDFGICC